jgi:hypothetical protein
VEVGEIMRSLQLIDGDLVLDGQNNLVFISGREEERQCIERILTTGQGEWFLNAAHGLDYTQLLGKAFDVERAKLALIDALHQEERLDHVEDITFVHDAAARALKVKIRVRMKSGNEIEEVISLG